MDLKLKPLTQAKEHPYFFCQNCTKIMIKQNEFEEIV